MAEYQLDARHVLCPLPVIRTQEKVESLQPGDRLAILCTDPGAYIDIPAWCEVNGHKYIDCTKDGRELTIIIEVG